MLSVLYLTAIPSPYKVSFFNELGKHCKLTVLFDKDKSNKRDNNWFDFNFDEFNGIILENNISKLLSCFNKFKYDVIIVSNYSTKIGRFSVLFLSYLRIPFIISVDGGLIDYDESFFKHILKKKLISKANAWLSTGKATNNYLLYYGADKEYIYNYPFTTMKNKDILKQPLTMSEKEKIRANLNIPYRNMILSVGRFIHSKGFDTLIKAAKELKEDTGIYIIGGDPTEELLDLKNRNEINNVHFINFQEYNILKEYYLAADLFVFPTRGDVWGLVINEAMANGLPVVTTTSCVAGIEMVKESVNGYLIPKDNVNLIVERTNSILNNERLRYHMSVKSIETAHEYTIEKMAKTTFDILANNY
ncbi:Glycosyltransferase involved in cell wall bisynthesis [Alkalibacterium gilvum]|uniref:Glycosyltransferase involved in cell wall bisynthesis n=1 Tax=Alkalibacterium gilvum TaxID=1130080 RepID=A0A1H6T9Z7_9LACT|nr:glycosyltransferase family 4 protein [Alkalibacterium gilvum]SEI76923.1 Glycosyltransferase involved in cell wall bisynthesis [Alkalibacterium gilvum]